MQTFVENDNLTFEQEEATAIREEADEIAPLTGWDPPDDLPDYNPNEGFIPDDGTITNDVEYAEKERQQRRQSVLDRARVVKEKNNAVATGGVAISDESREPDTPMQDVELVESIEASPPHPVEVQHLEFAPS